MDEKKLTNRSLAPVLSIAGSDSSGGAGIQADLKTMLANDCYGMSAITALTAQNTMGVTGIMDVTPEFLRKHFPNHHCPGVPESVNYLKLFQQNRGST